MDKHARTFEVLYNELGSLLFCFDNIEAWLPIVSSTVRTD